jgi:hypothetical protein
MSAAVTTPAAVGVAADRAARRGPTAPIPFTRLFLVEWRKQLDTRAGRWLLITIGIVTAFVLGVMGSVGDGNRSFADLLVGTEAPLSLLLPVVGILAATQEWSQRTALVTFALEPRRTRVGVAKFLAAVATGVVFVAAAVALAALTHLLLIAIRGADAQWGVEQGPLWGALLLVLLSMAQGVGFGALLLNTPAAIVSFYVVPAVLPLLNLFDGMTDVMPWIDVSTAGAPLMAGGMSGQGWAQLATSTVIWVVAPLVGGLIRIARSEIKSS